MMRRYIRPPKLRETLLGGLLMAAFAFGMTMDRGRATDTASILATDTATPTTGTSATTSSSDVVDGVAYVENAGGGAAKNIVRLVNKQDGRLRVKGNIQLNRIPGPTVAPRNIAFAYASCTDCQTFTVALQINLISRSANVVTPENVAAALNYQCTRCTSVAQAFQYVISVDDPGRVPPDVAELIKAMDRELNALHTDKSVTVEQADTRINAVIAQFTSLGDSLKQQRDEQTANTSPGATSLP